MDGYWLVFLPQILCFYDFYMLLLQKPVVEEFLPLVMAQQLDESPVTPVAEAVTPPNSPAQIPLPTCACRTTHAVLHSSSSDDSSGSRGASEEIVDIDGE